MVKHGAWETEDCSRPLFWLVSRKPCMESPNQYLSREPSFARIAPTSFEIQGSKVCSTIRPLTLRHCFGWFQRNQVWKAPTSTIHRNLLLAGLLQPVSRSKGPKCARLSAPSLCATVLVGFKETHGAGTHSIEGKKWQENAEHIAQDIWGCSAFMLSKWDSYCRVDLGSPSSPGTVGWEAHGTFLPISVAFWDPIWLPKLPSIFPRDFKNFQAFFNRFFV